MIPKNGNQFSEKIMLKKSMIPKSGNRFSEKTMLKKMERDDDSTKSHRALAPLCPYLKKFSDEECDRSVVS